MILFIGYGQQSPPESRSRECHNCKLHIVLSFLLKTNCACVIGMPNKSVMLLIFDK